MSEDYNPAKQGERRKTMEVKDKPTEAGVRLNNILTFLVFGVMSWVAVNINTMKNDIGEMRKDSAVQSTEIKHLEEKIDAHIADEHRHWPFDKGGRP